MFSSRKKMVKLVLAAAITLALGTAVTYAVERSSGKCRTCRGGTSKSYQPGKCPACHGSGLCNVCNGTGLRFSGTKACEHCWKP